jgi:hypothetical protein
VRAAMVPDASAWPWSSYRATAGLAVVPAWLETDWVLGQFGSGPGAAQEQYARFVSEGVAEGSV